VVEDDEDIRESLELILARHGYAVLGARDGVDALQQIRTHGRPGLILLDLRMPRMNGEELAAVLREDAALAPTPIVVLSGDANAREVERAIGARGLLAKPVDLHALLAMVGRNIGQ
jgi:chemosensory pili system protein ChpA (sensor histidine kinase/response regulator)